MKLLSIVGARPQFVKLAPIADACAAAAVSHVIVHTGQHYDSAMSDVFFQDLSIPSPDVHLGIGSAGHAAQTGAMLSALGPVLAAAHPDWVLVYGDTNSTLAGAIAAVKLHLPIAHLEAGLRSFNRRMPEEHNRVLTDHACDLLLAPSQLAANNLAAEGLASRTVIVGDVMVDVCLRIAREMADAPVSTLVPGLQARGYITATLHRAENTDDPDRLGALVNELKSLPLPVVLPVHPRLRARAIEAGVQLVGGSLRPIEPLPYRDMVRLVSNSRSVVTDSGGLQKEAFILGVPCVTLRSETEWLETLTDGWNILDPEAVHLAALVLRAVPSAPRGQFYGSGAAAPAVLHALSSRIA